MKRHAPCTYLLSHCGASMCAYTSLWKWTTLLRVSCCESGALVHFWVPLNGKSQRPVDFARVCIDSLSQAPPTHSFRLSCARAHYCSHGWKNGAVKIPKLFSQAVNREWSILYRLERLWPSDTAAWEVQIEESQSHTNIAHLLSSRRRKLCRSTWQKACLFHDSTFGVKNIIQLKAPKMLEIKNLVLFASTSELLMVRINRVVNWSRSWDFF